MGPARLREGRAFRPGEEIARASVFGGTEGSVGVVGKGGISAFLPRGSRDLIKGRVVYQGPVPAPVETGQEIGKLEIILGTDVLREAPVYANQDVGRGTLPQRAMDALKELLIGWI